MGTSLPAHPRQWKRGTDPADINSDGVVTVLDLLAVAGAWGQCLPAPATCSADLNADNTVNVLDLLIVISNWG